jgi:hypothetical protein
VLSFSEWLGNGDNMADENDKGKDAGSNQGEEPPKGKFKVDLFAKLTDQDWIDAMEYGRKVAEARDEEIRKALKGDDKK